ncbi:hypothetical protein B0H10DRAFT_2209916 [Mycena sp. CBHHK59/15]|nr:hypothetical protein B0H10DRAFT_2209916 [Mycena sp. CBHHK59/15]
MDTNDSADVLMFHKTTVVPRFRLSPPAARIKTVTDSGDLLALLLFNVAYDGRLFPSERRRLDLAACYLILAYTGYRLAEILVVVRHPETGRDTLTMSIKFAHHKGTDNKPKPTIFYFTPTKRLVFCLVTLMASLAVLDGAFTSPTLNAGVDVVFGARVSGHTPLRWKPERLRRPMFRRDADVSLDMGYEKAIGPKDWRRNVGNTVNVQASGAVRDQVMCHNNRSGVFQDAYLNRHVCFDVQNTVLGEPLQERMLGEPLQERMLGMLTHVGRTRDPRACSAMTSNGGTTRSRLERRSRGPGTSTRSATSPSTSTADTGL